MCDQEDTLRRSRRGELLSSAAGSYYWNLAGSGRAEFVKKESPKILGPDGQPIEKEEVPFGFRNV